jgi:hypothetical protein
MLPGVPSRAAAEPMCGPLQTIAYVPVFSVVHSAKQAITFVPVLHHIRSPVYPAGPRLSP